MLPPRLIHILNASGTGETVSQWQVYINQSSVTATLIWNIPTTDVAPSHSSLSQVEVIPVSHPTLDKPPHSRSHKSPSSRRRDRRRRERWKARRGVGNLTPQFHPEAPHHEGQDSPPFHNIVCETGMDYPSNLPSPRNCDNRTVLDSASSDSLSSAHGRSGNPDPHCPPKDLACASKDISPDTTALSSIDPNDKKLSGSDRHGYTDSELSHHDSTTSTSSDYSDCDLSFNIALLDHEDTGPEVPPSSSCHNDSPSIMYTANLLDYSGDEVTASSSKAPSIIPQQSDSDSDCELVDIPPSSLQTGMVDLDPPSDSGIPRSTCASRNIPVSTPAAVTPAPAVDPTVNPFSQDAGPDLPSSIPNTCRSAIDPSILSHSHRDSLDNVSVYSSSSYISQHSGAGHCSEHSDCLPSDSDTVESDIESPTCDNSNHPDTSIDPAPV